MTSPRARQARDRRTAGKGPPENARAVLSPPETAVSNDENAEATVELVVVAGGLMAANVTGPDIFEAMLSKGRPCPRPELLQLFNCSEWRDETADARIEPFDIAGALGRRRALP